MVWVTEARLGFKGRIGLFKIHFQVNLIPFKKGIFLKSKQYLLNVLGSGLNGYRCLVNDQMVFSMHYCIILRRNSYL